MHEAVLNRRALFGFGLGIGLSALLDDQCRDRQWPIQSTPTTPASPSMVMIRSPTFTMSKAVRGDKAITAEHGGATYHFVSQEHRTLFLANPAKYVPQYGGYCAYGASQGYNAPVEADKFTVVDGKLYSELQWPGSEHLAQGHRRLHHPGRHLLGNAVNGRRTQQHARRHALRLSMRYQNSSTKGRQAGFNAIDDHLRRLG
jgi:YHS domain-containing protein